MIGSIGRSQYSGNAISLKAAGYIPGAYRSHLQLICQVKRQPKNQAVPDHLDEEVRAHQCADATGREGDHEKAEPSGCSSGTPALTSARYTSGREKEERSVEQKSYRGDPCGFAPTLPS